MNKHYQRLILLISSIITIIVVGTFVFFFKIIQNKNEHASKVIQVLSEKMVDQQNAELLKSKFSEFQDLQVNIGEHFVDQTKIDTFVSYLEKIGDDNNAQINVKNVELSNKEKNTIIVSLTTIGDFNNVMKVVSLLENSSYQTHIIQVFVNKQTKVVQIASGNNQPKEEITSYWQADVVFNVLTLSSKNE